MPSVDHGPLNEGAVIKTVIALFFVSEHSNTDFDFSWVSGIIFFFVEMLQNPRGEHRIFFFIS